MTVDPWQTQALCRANETPEMWFPYKNPVHVATAKAICGTCSVPAPCAADAIERGEEFGIWAGVWMERDDNPHDQLRKIARKGKAA